MTDRYAIGEDHCREGQPRSRDGLSSAGTLCFKEDYRQVRKER